MIMLITSLLCCYVVLYSHSADSLVAIDTSQESISLHQSSPRHKRQAYPVFSASEGKLVIDSVGQTESGPWEDWTDGGAECSRTCGGGVKIETRKCSGSNCVGSGKRYVSCNTEPCEKGANDFRHEQCSVYDDKPLEGKYYKWKAYTKAPNKCELTCMPVGENFYYKWADKVIDGTKCDEFTNDICVEGFCLPLGCDNKLGSLVKDDKCGVCGGDGTTCKTMRGFFDQKHTGPRYVDIITLPVGAASIMIEEMKPTNNYLALKNESGSYYLNGNYKIDFPQTLEIAGTLFEYERNRHGTAGQEKIFSKGPLAEPVVVALLYQAEHTGIAYEYTLPLDETLPYHYVVDAWEPCSATCGKGIQTRKMTCVDRASQQPVVEDLCANSSIPETNRTCNSIDCETEWFTGEWEQCSSSCGDSGVQYRVVYCHKVSADGVRVTVDDEECANMTRPEVKQSCNRFSCPEWQAGPWSSCSKECGSAHQYRAVTCRSEKLGEEGKLVAAKQCNSTLKPTDKRTCNLGPCEGLRYVTSDWELCSKCNDTTEYRNVTCEDPNGKRYPEEKCKDKRPEDSRKCVNVVPCVYQWQASQWSECSSQCGHGHQTRTVHCTIDEDGYLRKMDEMFCDEKLKPDSRQNCTHEGEKCSGTFYSTQWSTCSVECGGGSQNRSVVCLDYDFKIRPGMCDESEKPEEVQNCNTDPCLACNETDFGCCPDGATVASGPYLEGCSNCSETEFGCCPDNYTIATSEDMSECPLLTTPPSESETNATEIEASGDGELVTETPGELVEEEEGTTTMIPDCAASEFGCCPDGNTTATTEDKSDCPEVLCNYTSAAGESVLIPCANLTFVNETSDVLNITDTFFGNETESNQTAEVHCSKTEFGCCPDWYTAANGTDFLGCPEIELGACNETKFGCCPDDMTLSRGPNFEGCGDPSCAASMFGCCKDRMTIAFGTHYEGCERANQPCETSKFGCCADGLTAALGTNGAGCDEDCRLTKFGCCPDGESVAKGANNEGCGCAASRYGCCPDGKSPATGANFQGCPETCARSYYGCCPDGKTNAQGPDNEGCPCTYTKFGCCPDGETAARGPNMESCDDCRLWKHGCCQDGKTKALGPDRQGCDLLVETVATTTYVPRIVSPSRIAACTLPKAEGQVCAQYVLSWFYNTTAGVCNAFWFGGCEGNDNRFGSEQECKDTCVEPIGTGVCYLPKISGPEDCGRREPRWHYDVAKGQCAPFYYNGCYGNANNFPIYEDCMALCQAVRLEQTPAVPSPAPGEQQPMTTTDLITQTYPTPEDYGTTTPALGDVCDYRPDAGPCNNFQEFWSYDDSARQCTIFQFGGCGGNPNRFYSRAECEQTCRHKFVAPTGENVCSMPLQRGYCDERLPRWYYDAASKRCVSFIFTGCDGNDNNFESEDACKESCDTAAYEVADDLCLLGKDSGPCDKFVPKWFFNAADGTCGRFYYGGCHGNKNRFDKLEECEERCAKKMDPCVLPPVPGPCSGTNVRFYWDSNARQCKRFNYGGCLGNGNRFETVQECQSRCSTSGSKSEQLNVGVTRPPPVFQPTIRMTQPARTGEVCLMNVDPGTCHDYNYRFYFNHASRRCEAFIYTGCGGNDNRFERVDQCETTCAYYLRRNVQADVLLTPDDDLYLFRPISVSIPKPEQPLSTPKMPLLKEMTTSHPIGQENVAIDNNEDICNLPPDSGICKNMTTRWYFDTTHKDCRRFNYGGCAGNLNNFENLQLCQEYCMEDQIRENVVGDTPSPKIGNLGSPIDNKITEESYPPQVYPPPMSPLPEMCKQPKDEGDCFESQLRYYYDSEKQKCQSFQYTNCKGNSNRFTSIEECDRACGQYRDPGVCSMPVHSGNCLASVMKWFWNPSKAKCESFVYSGCGGNGNRFGSKEDCESLCHKESESLPVDSCSLKPQPGSCDGSMQRYFFDAESKSCKTFNYSGCQGNENNFETASACELRCFGAIMGATDHCHFSYDSGPCSEAIAQYYYDKNAGECKLFTYGGCRGNRNRFDTKIQCEHECKASDAPHSPSHNESVCRLPMDEGDCDDSEIRYYYNFGSRKCEIFTYTGCGGNDNKFSSEEECYEKCFDMPKLMTLPSTTPFIEPTYRAVYDMFTGRHGLTINVHCRATPEAASSEESNEIENVHWYNNGRPLDLKKQAHLSILKNGTLHIEPATEEDSGNYSCSHMQVIIDPAKSTAVAITVKSLKSEATDSKCVDDSSKANCELVKLADLCDHLFYGKFCCRTCKEAKRQKEMKKLKLKVR